MAGVLYHYNFGIETSENKLESNFRKTFWSYFFLENPNLINSDLKYNFSLSSTLPSIVNNAAKVPIKRHLSCLTRHLQKSFICFILLATHWTFNIYFYVSLQYFAIESVKIKLISRLSNCNCKLIERNQNDWLWI